MSMDHDDLLAAEWALGLLDAAEHGAAEARRLADPAFATLCDRWAEHAAALIDGETAIPAPAVWQRISDSLPANDAPSEPAADRVGDLRRAVGRWRAATAAMTLVAIGLGVVLALPTHRQVAPPAPKIASTPPIVVILTGSGQAGIASVSIDRATGTISVAAKSLDVGRRAAELWVIPANKIPLSLGLLPVDAATRSFAGSGATRLIAPGVTLAVSLEPLGGSPTGKPTGPVIVSGIV